MALDGNRLERTDPRILMQRPAKSSSAIAGCRCWPITSRGWTGLALVRPAAGDHAAELADRAWRCSRWSGLFVGFPAADLAAAAFTVAPRAAGVALIGSDGRQVAWRELDGAPAALVRHAAPRPRLARAGAARRRLSDWWSPRPSTGSISVVADAVQAAERSRPARSSPPRGPTSRRCWAAPPDADQPTADLLAVIRRLAGDCHVVDVALAPAGLRHAQEPAAGLHRAQIRIAGVAHGGAQAADELVDDVGDRARDRAPGPRSLRAPA